MAKQKSMTLDQLRARANDKARSILDRIWDHCWGQNEAIRDLTLYSKFDGKPAVLKALSPLGGKVVFSMVDAGKERYHLHLLGVLVSNRGADAEVLLVKYLEYAWERYQAGADDTRITSAQLLKRFGLSQEQLLFLQRLLPMAPFGGSVQHTTNPADPWFIELPNVIADVSGSEELRKFFNDQVMVNFDPDVPVTETQRSLYHATSDDDSDSQRFWRGNPLALAKSVGEGAIVETTFGRYTIGRPVGEGGAGKVFEATDEKGEQCAIKLLDPQKAKGDNRRRFQNEIQFGIRNKHENIIRIKDHGLYNDGKGWSPFYVMPLYKSTLRKLMKASLPKERVLPYFTQLLNGVEAAHILETVHRDLKPENVLYDPVLDRLVVADFGIAQFNQEELYTLVETGAADRLANFQYAAPEQRHRGQPIDRRADIYALGLILNELFTGEIPLGSGHKTIVSVVADYAYLDTLVEKMRQQSASERPATIAIVKQELITRGNEFVSQQRLSSLRGTVISEEEIDDPLILDPIRLVGADYDMSGQLILELSQAVNDEWSNSLRSFGGYRAVIGASPREFTVEGNKAFVPVRGADVQQIIDYFKEWLPNVNQRYKEKVSLQRMKKKAEASRKLKAEIEQEEKRQQILRNIRI